MTECQRFLSATSCVECVVISAVILEQLSVGVPTVSVPPDALALASRWAPRWYCSLYGADQHEASNLRQHGRYEVDTPSESSFFLIPCHSVSLVQTALACVRSAVGKTKRLQDVSFRVNPGAIRDPTKPVCNGS